MMLRSLVVVYNERTNKISIVSFGWWFFCMDDWAFIGEL